MESMPIAFEDLTPKAALLYLKEKVDRWPIKMSAIQLYADMFEKSNQNHIETVFEIKKLKTEIAQLHKESKMILYLLKKLIK